MALITTNLQLSVSLCQTNNCKSIKLSEVTGEYNATDNPGGWDDLAVNNPSIDEVTNVDIEIELPNGSIWNFDSTDIGSLFPTIDSSVEVEFDSTDFGNTSIVPLDDGFYKVTYTVQGNVGPNNYEDSYTETYLLTCQTSCCIDKMFHLASQSDCTDCKNEKLDKAIEAKQILTQAEYAARCGKINMAKKLLAKAQWICNTKNCLNC